MKYLIITFTLITLFSCENTRREMLVNVSGKPGEILVVMEKNAWNSEPGNALKRSLMKLQEAIPQEEPMFKLYQIPPTSFGDFFQSNRNIIFVKPYHSSDSAAIISRKDMWAKPQAYMEITAPNSGALIDLLNEKSDEILDFFRYSEIKRLQDTYQTFQEKEISAKLAKHHIGIVIPKGYKMDVDTNDFIWISSETPTTSQGIFIYEYNYTDSNTFTNDFLIHKRNRVLKKNVPGPLPGSWMTTEQDFPLVSLELNFKNRYVYELRGLWKIENDFMGGPFISLTTIDEKRNKVITIEAYIYAPKYDKVDYIRQMEAILYSFEVLDN